MDREWSDYEHEWMWTAQKHDEISLMNDETRALLGSGEYARWRYGDILKEQPRYVAFRFGDNDKQPCSEKKKFAERLKRKAHGIPKEVRG